MRKCRELARTLIWGSLLLILVGLLISPSYSEDNNPEELFPVPDNLQKNVAFWITAFTRYGSSHTIIHDNDYLDIIYEVVNVDSIFYGLNVSERTKERKINAIKKEYRAILLKFHSSPPLDVTKLNKRELRVYRLWRGSSDSRKYRRAAYNIRSQRALRDSFIDGIKRSGRYIEEMKSIFRRTGVPEDLLNMAFVESMFNYRTYSRMGAAGIWQFTRYTGREFLTINYEIDERFDPLKSTEAAAKLLKKNYEVLGSWPLAITVYNHGLNGMRRAKSRLKTSDLGVIVEKYRSRLFGFASKNFYAEFVAAKHVAENEAIYFGNVAREVPLHYIVFRLPDYVKFSTLLTHFGLTQDQVVHLNPSLRSPILTNKRCIPKGFELRLAWGTENIEEIYAQIPDTEKFGRQVRETLASGGYRVRRGDTLSGIALRAGVSTRELMTINGIGNPHRISVGQRLQIPSKTQLVAKSTLPKEKEKVANRNIVQVASRQNLADSSEEIQAVGPMQPENVTATDEPRNDETIYIDPSISFPNFVPRPSGNVIEVASGETIGHYADWLAIPTQRLRNLNGLTFAEDIQVGRKIRLTFSNMSVEEFHRKRMEFHQGVREDFFERFRIDSVRTHIVASGENIWMLCKEVYEVPLWLAKEYNSQKNLDNLKTGELLQFPILATVVK